MDFYNDTIMYHALDSKHFKKLEVCDYSSLGHNPSCGDKINVEVKIDNNIITDIAFSGSGCAISKASSSIMADTLIGKTKEEALNIIKIFEKMVTRENITEEEKQLLKEAAIFENVKNMPSRVKCALLSYKTLEEILSKTNNNI